jgi:para-aminobenzoate synthetase/4-amino-4-deoxychorismate lyase
LSISSVFIVAPRSLRSSQAVTVGTPLSTAHLPRPDPVRGVFETILVVDGRPVELDAHLARLAASARELFGPPTAARIAGPARALALDSSAPTAVPALARLRLTLAPDGEGRLDLSATTAAVEAETVFPTVDRAPSLVPVTVPSGLGAHKWADRRLLEGAAAMVDGALPLIVDGDTALEAERANLFAVLDGVLVTPPLDGRILPGVARARTLEIANELGIEAAERQLALDDLETADELFLTGSIRGIEPVCVGPIATRLADELRRRWLP